MRRIMLLLLMCCVGSVALSTDALAKAQAPSKTVIIRGDQLPSWVVYDAMRMLRSRHKGVSVRELLYVGDFPDTGDVVRLSPAAIDSARSFCDVDVLCGQGVMPIGCSSPRHYDPKRSAAIMSEFYNALLGPPRADMLADTVDLEVEEPYNGTIRNFRPGVLLVFYEYPATETSLPATYHDTTTDIQKVEGIAFDRIQPFVGYEHVALEHGGYGAPVIGLEVVLKTRIGAIAAFGYEGRIFDWPDHAVLGGGLQFGDDDGLFGIIETKGGWRLDTTDHYESRAIGLVVGPGVGGAINFKDKKDPKQVKWAIHFKLHAGAGIFHLDDDVRNANVPGVTFGGRVCVSF
ncbi:MAG: hypothetical protein V1907_00770 [Candidatus Kerfeldbacteria bacterium]